MTSFQPSSKNKDAQTAVVTPISLKGGVTFAITPTASTELAPTSDLVDPEDFTFGDEEEDEIDQVIPESIDDDEVEIPIDDTDEDSNVIEIDDDEYIPPIPDDNEDEEELEPDDYPDAFIIEDDNDENDQVIVLDGVVNTDSLYAYFGTMIRQVNKLLEDENIDEETRRMLETRLKIYEKKKKEISEYSIDKILKFYLPLIPGLQNAYENGDADTKNKIEESLKQLYIYEQAIKKIKDDKELLALSNFADVKKAQEALEKEYKIAKDTINEKLAQILKSNKGKTTPSTPKPSDNKKTDVGSYDKPFDASSIEYGYASAYSKDKIKLYTDLGKNVHIGKEEVLADGTRMFALYQADGTGYAWVKEEDLVNLLGENFQQKIDINQEDELEEKVPPETEEQVIPPGPDDDDEIEITVPPETESNEELIQPPSEEDQEIPIDDDDDDLIEEDGDIEYDDDDTIIYEIVTNKDQVNTDSLFSYYETITNRIATVLNHKNLDVKTREELNALYDELEAKKNIENYDIEKILKKYFKKHADAETAYNNSDEVGKKELETYVLQLHISNEVLKQIESDLSNSLITFISNDELKEGLELLKDEYTDVKNLLNNSIQTFIINHPEQKNDEPQSTEDYFDQYGDIGARNYGANQRMFRNMILYNYNGKNYTQAEMKEMIKNAKAKGEAIPIFTPVYTDRYKQYVKYLVDRGFDEDEAYIILSSINNTGICSYAATVDTIFEQFMNKEDKFEKIFGYPMYEEVDGKMVLNGGKLILDLWIYANDKANGGKLIKNGHLDSKMITDEINIDGTKALNTDKQKYISTSAGVKDDIITGFLQTKKKDLTFKSTDIIRNDALNKLTDKDIENIQKQIGEALANGEGVRMDVYCNLDKGNIPVHLFSLTKGIDDTQIDSEGHAMCVIGYNSDGIIVSTWGNKYVIPYDDLKNGGRFNLFRCQIK